MIRREIQFFCKEEQHTEVVCKESGGTIWLKFEIRDHSGNFDTAIAYVNREQLTKLHEQISAVLGVA